MTDLEGRQRGKYLLMFRKIVRKVILKRFWQGIFDANLSLDKIRSTTVFRRTGVKELLFQQEKRILTIPFLDRDSVQRKFAELIITRLNCMGIFEPVRINQKFRKRRKNKMNYFQGLRRRLATHLRYVEYCKGRTIIKVSFFSIHNFNNSRPTLIHR